MSKELIILMLELGRAGLISTAQAVPEDKLHWEPLNNGRSVLDLLRDAAQTPQMAILLLRSKGEIKPSYELFQQLKHDSADWTRERCIEVLTVNTDGVIAALNETTEEELEQPVLLPIGGEITLPMGGWIMMTYRTFMSRTAQINYIQTLYGDFESH